MRQVEDFSISYFATFGWGDFCAHAYFFCGMCMHCLHHPDVYRLNIIARDNDCPNLGLKNMFQLATLYSVTYKAMIVAVLSFC